jgi:hypothetical protein
MIPFFLPFCKICFGVMPPLGTQHFPNLMGKDISGLLILMYNDFKIKLLPSLA